MGAAIGGEDDLAAGKMKSIEGVEKLLLDIFFAGNKLDVINKKTVRLAIFVFELVDSFGAESVDEFVTKGFGGKVANFEVGIFFEEFVADSLHKMGLADSDPTPDEERIVGDTGVFDNSLGGGVGEVVAVANNEMLKSVFGMEIGTEAVKSWGILGVGRKKRGRRG